eukprot:2776289-Karenia_brevis.AAC.1
MRKKKYQEENRELKKANRSILEQHSVGRPSQAEYARLGAQFEKEFMCVPMGQMTNAELDGLVVDFMTEEFFAGETANIGQKILAYLDWKYPSRQFTKAGSLPRAKRALKGFSKLAPVFSRLPIPEGVVYGMAMMMVSSGNRMAAICTIVSMNMYLRPGEMQN